MIKRARTKTQTQVQTPRQTQGQMRTEAQIQTHEQKQTQRQAQTQPHEQKRTQAQTQEQKRTQMQAQTLTQEQTQREAVDYRHYRLSKDEMKRYYPVTGCAAFIIGLLFYHNIFIATLMVLLAIPCRKYYEAYLAAKRQTELSVQFKDLLASLSVSFSTGRQLTDALREADDNLRLIYAADTPILTEVRYMIDRLIGNREHEKAVLYDFADRSACEDIADFVDVYFICRTTGGDTIRAIRRASEQIIDKIDIRNEIVTLTAQKKYEARILSGLPLLILLFLQLTSPDYIAPLYGTLIGIVVMTLSLAVQIAAFLWSAKITDIRI